LRFDKKKKKAGSNTQLSSRDSPCCKRSDHSISLPEYTSLFKCTYAQVRTTEGLLKFFMLECRGIREQQNGQSFDQYSVSHAHHSSKILMRIT
jgi:hypothetical protein